MYTWHPGFKKVLLAAMLVLIGGLNASPSLADTRRVHALLVGVSGYPSLSGYNAPGLDQRPIPLRGQQLNGPSTDVALLRDVLLARGIPRDRIRIVADRVPGADVGLPTRAAIMSAIGSVAAAAKPGDLVMAYFAGHGSRAPQSTSASLRENDGMDEIFLPRDVGSFDVATGEVANAIRDDEIAERLQALRIRGVDVWLVMDACHSGGFGLRSSDDSVQWRGIEPSALGVPSQTTAASDDAGRSRFARPAPARGPQAPQPGAFIAFYAVHADELAPEVLVPADRSNPDAVWSGAFSRALAAALHRDGQRSYRQLADEVLATFRVARGVRGVRPVFEGTEDNFDRVALGAGVSDSPRGFTFRRKGEMFEIDGGELLGVSKGARLKVIEIDGRSSGMELEVITASAFRATAKSTMAPLPNPLENRLDGRAVLTAPARHWRLPVLDGTRNSWSKSVSSELIMWVDDIADAAFLLEATGPNRVALRENAETPAGNQDPEPSAKSCAPADVLRVPSVPDAALRRRPPITIDLDGFGNAERPLLIAQALERVALGVNVSQLLSDPSFGQRGTRWLTLDLRLKRKGCEDWFNLPAAAEVSLSDGDQIELTVRNRSNSASRSDAKTYDVNLLFLDGTYRIHSIDHFIAGEARRLLPGESLGPTVLTISSDIAGPETLGMIAAEADRNTVGGLDLSWLARGVSAAPAIQRSGSSSSLEAILAAAASGRAPESAGGTRAGETAFIVDSRTWMTAASTGAPQ